MADSAAIRAGRAFIELFADKSALVRTLRTVEADLGRFAARVRAIGRALFAGGAALGGGLLAAAKNFATAGTDVDRVARATGMASEKLTSLQHAAVVSGTSVESLNSAVQGMQQTMLEAARGSDSAIMAFNRLGISGQQLRGLDPDDQLKLISDRLRNVKNPILQASTATEIFGGSAAELLPFLQKGSAGIQEMQDEAVALGLVLSEEDRVAAVGLSSALARLWQMLIGIKNQVGAALAPVLTELATEFGDLLGKVVLWVRENRGLVVSLAKMAAAAVAIGAGLTGLSFVISGLGSGIGIFARILPLAASGLGKLLSIGSLIGRALLTPISAIGTMIAKAAVAIGQTLASAAAGGFSAVVSAVASLMTPIGVLGIALVALGGYFLYMSGVAQQAIGGLKQLWKDLQQDASDALGGIADALAAGDLALAAEILWLTLKLEWQRGINFLNGLWQEFKAFTLTTWNEAASNLAAFFLNAVSAISAAWTETVDFLADAWSAFTGGFMKMWFTAVGFVQKAWTRLKALFDADIDVDAEVNRINRETEEKTSAVDAERDQTIGNREEARRKKLAQIEAERRGGLDANEQMRNAENERIRAEADKSIAGTQSQVDAARKRFDEARQKAKEEREQPAKKLAAAVPAKDNGLGFAQASVTGTFSSRALGGLGAGNPAQQTAKNTARMADTQEETNRLLKQQTKPTFGTA